MTPDLAVRMFGATAVCADTQSPCTLTPAANLWINNVNASMDGGRCEGFAVLSGVFFLGLSSSSSFGAGSTRDLTLDGNIPLQQELAYWYATQNVSVVTQATKALEAKDAIAFLATFLKSGTPDYYRIGSYGGRRPVWLAATRCCRPGTRRSAGRRACTNCTSTTTTTPTPTR